MRLSFLLARKYFVYNTARGPVAGISETGIGTQKARGKVKAVDYQIAMIKKMIEISKKHRRL